MSIYLGTEWLRCPVCRYPVRVDVMHDLPAEDWLRCPWCHYRAIMDYRPILDKYGIPHGVSKPEALDIARYLPREVARIAMK